MEQEEPMCNKCCYFIPLECVIVLWAICKLVLLALFEYYGVISLIFTVLYGASASGLMLILIFLVPLFLNSTLLVFLLTAVLKNNYKLIRIYCCIRWFSVVFEFLIVLGIYEYVIKDIISRHDTIYDILIYIVLLVLEMGMLAAVQSKKVKLGNKERCQQYTEVAGVKHPTPAAQI